MAMNTSKALNFLSRRIRTFAYQLLINSRHISGTHTRDANACHYAVLQVAIAHINVLLRWVPGFHIIPGTFEGLLRFLEGAAPDIPPLHCAILFDEMSVEYLYLTTVSPCLRESCGDILLPMLDHTGIH